MTSTIINQRNQAEIINNSAGAILSGRVEAHDDDITLQAPQAQDGAGKERGRKSKQQTELAAAARRKGLTVKDLASLMGVNYSHLCSVANGRRPWSPMLRARAMAVLGQVPGQGTVYRQGGVITGESSFIRERAREKGMSLKALAVAVGVSYGYMTQAARGQRNMSPGVQARVESALGGPVEIAPAQLSNRLGSVASGGSTWIRERARELGLSMGELAKRVGVSRGYMSDVARGHRHLSPEAQARVEAVWRLPSEAAETPTVDPRALWEAHGISQNEAARRAGISCSMLSQIMSGNRTRRGTGGSRQSRGRRDSHRGPQGPVGPHGGPWHFPERGGAAGRHQLLHALADHERQPHPVGGLAATLARGAFPALGGGTGGPSRGQGDGLEEGREERRGGQGRRRARRSSSWRQQPRRRHGGR